LYSGVDCVVGSLTSAFGRAKFFSEGWGPCDAWTSHILNWKSEILVQHQTRRQKSATEIGLSWSNYHVSRRHGFFFREGRFVSPVVQQLAKASGRSLELPIESAEARFLLASPTEQLHATTPFVLLLAGTGEHTYSRRLRGIVEPLLRDGVGAIILTNAYYGERKPQRQFGSKLRKVSDLLALGYTTVEEARVLLHWLYDGGCERLCVAGVSQGGLHATMTASLFPHPIAVVPAFAPESACYVFTRGILGRNCDWRSLDADLPRNAAASNALDHMEHVLQLTDIRNFPAPPPPQRAVLVAAEHDLYVSPSSTNIWRRHWPWAELRWVRAGHVTGILFQSAAVCAAIRDALNSSSSSSSSGSGNNDNTTSSADFVQSVTQH